MKIEEAAEELQAIADRSESAEDVRRELARLSPEAKFKMIYSRVIEEFCEDVKKNGVWMIDFLEENNLVNDYRRGVSVIENPLGFMRALSVIVENSAEMQSRQELQAQDADTQFAVQIMDAITDRAQTIKSMTEELISLQAHYAAVLQGRRLSVHYQNADGDFEPFSEAELQQIEDRRIAADKAWEDELKEFDAWLTEERSSRK